MRVTLRALVAATANSLLFRKKGLRRMSVHYRSQLKFNVKDVVMFLYQENLFEYTSNLITE